MAAEECPIQEWYPRCRATLVVRFEEFGAEASSVPPGTKQTLRKGTGSDKELEYVPDPEAPEGTTRYLLQAKAAAAAEGKAISESSADKLTHAIGGIVPLRATHTRNGLDKSDTLTIDLLFMDAPFDPRCVRSCGVEYYLGTISEDQASEEQSGTVQFLNDVDDSGNSNKRFSGWADSWEVEYKDGSPVISLSCRDHRSVLIDQEAPPQLHVDPKKPLDEAVADYLSNFPQFVGISVEYRGEPGEVAPVLSKVQPVKGQRKDAGQHTGKDKAKVMDYLTEMVGMCGCILLMKDTVLIISKPRTVLKRGNVRKDDIYPDDRSINGLPLPNRAFIYGHNVKEMKIGRKYDEEAPTAVELRCYVGSLKKTIVVRFPDVTTSGAGSDKATHVHPGDKGGDKKWMVWRVQGVSDPKDLAVMAQSIHEQAGRRELNVELTTVDFASFGGDNLYPDVLDMMPGDSFDVYVMREQEEFTSAGVVEDSALVGDKLVEFLVGLGHDEGLAKAYAASYVAGGFQTTFRGRTMRTEWAADSGVTFSIMGSNFVEVRLDKELVT